MSEAEIMEPEMPITPANGIVKAEPAAIRPTTPRAIIMAEALKEDTEQRALLQMYVKQHMKQGVDFGVIPGTEKPTLLKPGAEKLTDLFRCTPEFELTERVENWDAGLFNYEFKCKITARDSGQVLAVGVGSANSRESRYRWRNAGRKCPHCGKEAICKSKFAPRDNPSAPPGFYCFSKKGGCGAEFAHDDESITGQEQGKVENDDVFTLVNTILKMAKKRALVDGAIALARCSDIFTQDVEDFADGMEAPSEEPQAHARRSAPRSSTAARQAPPENRTAQIARAAKVKAVIEKAKAQGLDAEKFGAIILKALGHSKPNGQWTDEDIEAVEQGILAATDIPF